MVETEQDKEIEKKWGVDPDTLYRSIGHFVFNFSRFEDVVRGRVTEGLGLGDRQRAIIMPSMDFAYLCRACKLLFEERFVDESAKLKELIEILNEGLEINASRVRVAHGSWYLNRPAGFTVHTSRNKLEEGTFFTKPGELDTLAERLFVLRHRLVDLAQVTV
jgi:hypothetical protein